MSCCVPWPLLAACPCDARVCVCPLPGHTRVATLPCAALSGLGEYISGAIMFEETLMQSSAEGVQFVDILKGQGIVPGIKVDTGLQVCRGCGGRDSSGRAAGPG